jgi:SAM-dependent methyltransferase
MQIVKLLYFITLFSGALGHAALPETLCGNALVNFEAPTGAAIEFDGSRYVLYDPESVYPIPITDGNFYSKEVTFNHLGITKEVLKSMAGKTVVSIGEGMGALLPALIDYNSLLAAPMTLKAYEVWYDTLSVIGKPPLEKYFMKYRAYLERGNVYRLPRPDGSVDFAFSHAVFWHLSDPARALVEVLRVLRVGGQFHVGPVIEAEAAVMMNLVREKYPNVEAEEDFLMDSRVGPIYRIIFRKKAP